MWLAQPTVLLKSGRAGQVNIEFWNQQCGFTLADVLLY